MDRYGAIAYSKRTGHYGYSSRALSRGEAEDRALRNCEGRDCRIEVWFRNSCGALATGSDGYVTGWAHDTSASEARERALRECRDRDGRRCRVIIWTCAR
ncbi:MAG TPA: DUF4189 domain-containing protein [Thermoanaerobaculia bacterium]|nr:DUF4189 domain-containing protein [Thermoanaerobaculia bacterium]